MFTKIFTTKNTSQLPLTVIAFIILLIFFFVIRLVQIQSTPSVISHDEIYYPAQARALAVSGSDPTGTWKPWHLTSAHPLYAELPGVVMTPAAFFFTDPIIAAKITHIFLGTLLCGVLSLLALVLTKERNIAVITLLIAGFNPWLFQFSRMGFDALFSLFFYLTAVAVFLHFGGKKKLWSIPFFFLGFFQYQGLKVVFLPVVFLTALYDFLRSHTEQVSLQSLSSLLRKQWSTLVVLIFSVLLFSLYLFGLSNQLAGERTTDLIFSDERYITTVTNQNRQLTLPSNATPLFLNKVTTLFDRFTSQYFSSFSLKHLFVSGEPLRNPFSVWTHGIFYLIDLPLIIVGAYYLFSRKKYRLSSYYLLALLLISPLADAMSAKGTWTMFRSSLLVPILILFSSVGLWSVWKRKQKMLFSIVVLLYLASIARFMFVYFYSYPVHGTLGEYFSERVIANYILRNPDRSIVVYASEPRFMYESILVFTNAITKDSIHTVNKSYENHEYRIANVLVTNACVDLTDQSVISIYNRTSQFCDTQLAENNQLTLQIPSLIDSGAVYTVHNDSFCSEYDQNRYSRITENVLAVEKISDEQFCRNFFIRN